MQIATDKRREDVATTIRSCLIARQEDVTVHMLEQDYEDIEGEKIPFREFQCPSLMVFLRQLTNTLWIDTKNGRTILHPVESQKTQHVSSLVQKQRPKDRQRVQRRKSRRPYRGFQGGGMRVTIDSRLLMNLVKQIKQDRDGITFKAALDYVNKFSYPVQMSREELELQLKEISHEVLIWDDHLYPTYRGIPSTQQNSSNDSPRVKPSSLLARNNRSRSSISRLENRPEPTNFKPVPKLIEENRPREALAQKNPELKSYAEPVQKLDMEKIREVSQEAPAGKNSEANFTDEILFRPAGFTAFGEDQHVPKIGKRISLPRDNGQVSQNGFGDQRNLSRRHNQDYPGRRSSTPQAQNLNQQNGHSRNSVSFDSNSYKDEQESFPYKTSTNHKLQSSPIVAENSFNSNGNSHGDEEPDAACDKVRAGEVYEDENSFGEDTEEDLSLNIKMSTRIRLSKLIQQYPEGIWCAELPKKYLHEYSMPLIYAELGFATVRDFASHFPNIFHCIKPADAGDYKLYSADKPPPDLCNEERPVNVNIDSLKEMYKVAALPEESDPKLLLPEGAMEIGESIRPISVAELGGEDGIEEIEVLNVFSPSFFWVQLRKNLTKFKKLSHDLNTFYEKNQKKYKIPLFFLEMGLNVACIHSEKWQRGIVKSVMPEGRSTVQFYDSGLEKSYALDEIFFLHRMFSHVPAQVIPCGLFNVKPFQTTKWSKSVTWEFTSKTSIPLIATIGSINLEENSMLLTLTDTRGEDDFHINDWMCEQKFGEAGQIIFRNRNFAFWYYKKSLERKGYDSSAIHKIRPVTSISNGYAEDLETDVGYKPVETEPPIVESSDSRSEEPKPVSLKMKKIQASLAKYVAKQEAENLESQKSHKEIPTSEYKQSSKSCDVSPLKSTPAIETEANIEIFKAFLLQESHKSEDHLNTSRRQALFQKHNLCNQDDDSSQNFDTSIATTSSSSDLIPIRPPLILNEITPSTGEKKGDSFFGSIKSECGGNGRMEPINWTKVRSALAPKKDDVTKKPEVDSKPETLVQRIPKKQVPLANSSILNVVENDPNSTFYEKNICWVPRGNLSSYVSSNSPLLKLKQKIHTNSYKQSDVLVSSKILGIFNGKIENAEEDSVEEPIRSNGVNIQKQKVVPEENQVRQSDVDQSKQKVQLPPRLLRLLEMQNKGLKANN